MSAEASPVPVPTAAACPVCDRPDLEPMLEVAGVPAHVGVLWPSADEARSCPRGDISLALCAGCGHLTNVAFDPAVLDYTLPYDNALHGSSVFTAFESELATRLVDGSDAASGTIVEIGPGDGHFLRLLAERSGGRAVGFEPGHTATVRPFPDVDIEILGSEFAASLVEGPVPLVCCRQVLEHVPTPRALLDEIALALGSTPGSVAYLEVPDAEMLLDALSIWDLVYEHCHYFGERSLHRLVELAGLSVVSSWSSFGGQFLSVEVVRPPSGRPRSADGTEPIAVLEDGVRRRAWAFAEQFDELLRRWRAEIAGWRRAGTRVALWGGGARAVTFANLVAPTGGIDLVVDVNPAKQGTHLAGTGHEIAEPERLRSVRPDVVVVLNPLYVEEIEADLAEMGLDPEVRST